MKNRVQEFYSEVIPGNNSVRTEEVTQGRDRSQGKRSYHRVMALGTRSSVHWGPREPQSHPTPQERRGQDVRPPTHYGRAPF